MFGTPADVYARKFAERPLALVEVLNAFWNNVNTAFEWHRDRGLEFHATYPFDAEELFDQLNRIVEGWSAAATKSSALRDVEERYMSSIGSYLVVLDEISRELRARTYTDFRETVGLIEFALESPTKEKSPSRQKWSKKKPIKDSKTWVKWILAHWHWNKDEDKHARGSKGLVAETLTSNPTDSTVYDHLNPEKWAPPDQTDFDYAVQSLGDLDLVEYLRDG